MPSLFLSFTPCFVAVFTDFRILFPGLFTVRSPATREELLVSHFRIHSEFKCLKRNLGLVIMQKNVHVMSGHWTHVPRNVNMEGLRRGYLFPEVLIKSAALDSCSWILSPHILLFETFSVIADNCCLGTCWSDIHTWVWTRSQEPRRKVDKTWNWWHHAAYTRHHNDGDGWGDRFPSILVKQNYWSILFQTLLTFKYCSTRMPCQLHEVIEAMELSKATWYNT